MARLPAKLAAQADAIFAGQHRVENGQVETLADRQCGTLGAAAWMDWRKRFQALN
jgi:hypothetical protein